MVISKMVNDNTISYIPIDTSMYLFPTLNSDNYNGCNDGIAEGKSLGSTEGSNLGLNVVLSLGFVEGFKDGLFKFI